MKASINFLRGHGYYINRELKGGGHEYLSKNGNWEGSCINGWFKTKTQAEIVLYGNQIENRMKRLAKVRLIEALEFYADPDSWKVPNDDSGNGLPIFDDKGKMAREALGKK